MFSSMKMEEYMESELSGIFRVKLVTKHIVFWSPGTHFMHMSVKRLLKEILDSKIFDLPIHHEIYEVQ